MVTLYRFFRRNRWLLYIILVLTTALFAWTGSKCHFEENIAKLLPPTDNTLSIDLAFSDLKVKDKVFVQVVPRDSTAVEDLSEWTSAAIGAMDQLMQTVEVNDHDSAVLSTFYEVDPELLFDVANWATNMAPAYLDFTDEQMDSLVSEEHIRKQIASYVEFMDTELGQTLYDYIGYDPCGILLSKLPLERLQSNSDSLPKSFTGNHFFAGYTCFGFITPHLSSMDSGRSAKLLGNLRDAISEVEKQYPEVKIYYHGTIVQSANNAGRIKRDLLMTMGISLAVILLLLAVILKQPGDIVLLLLPLGYGALFALSCMYLMQGGMSLMAIGLGAIVLGVALSYCLHVMIHYKYVGNVSQTISEQQKPVMLGSLTTIGAFIGLVFTESALLRDFGWFASFAMVGTTIGSLVFMPHFFRRNVHRNERAFRFLERINDYELDRREWVMILVVLVVGVTMAFSGKYQFDNNLKNINYTSPEVMRSRQIWDQNHNHGYLQQYYAAYGKTVNEALLNLEGLEHSIDSLREIGQVSSLTRTSAFMPSLELQQRRIDHWKRYFTPSRQQEVWARITRAAKANAVDAAMFESFREMMAADLQPELIYDAGVVPDKIMSNLIEQVGDFYLVFEPIRMPAENLSKVNVTLTNIKGAIVLDPFYYTTGLVELIHDDFSKILLISSIFVFIVLLLSFRRIVLALIAFLPMFLSWYVVLGAMALTGRPFNLINILVSSFVFGIGVDYSIFIMEGLISRARGESGRMLAYHKTAITISATIITVCMASLVFAVHPAMRSIGFASVVGMVTTIVLSYTIEPWLFRQCMKSEWLRKRLL